jgi:hypothetical protein
VKEKAQVLLRSLLAHGPYWCEDIFKAAEAQDISLSTLRNVQKDLGIVSKKNRGDGKWYWSFPLSTEGDQVDSRTGEILDIAG